MSGQFSLDSDCWPPSPILGQPATQLLQCQEVGAPGVLPRSGVRSTRAAQRKAGGWWSWATATSGVAQDATAETGG